MNAKANDIKEKTRQLCERLYLAAKTSPTRRFHALYDKVYRKDLLGNAWEQVKQKDVSGVLVRYADDCAPRGHTRDEGGPLGAGLQEQSPNHPELHR